MNLPAGTSLPIDLIGVKMSRHLNQDEVWSTSTAVRNQAQDTKGGVKQPRAP